MSKSIKNFKKEYFGYRFILINFFKLKSNLNWYLGPDPYTKCGSGSIPANKSVRYLVIAGCEHALVKGGPGDAGDLAGADHLCARVVDFHHVLRHRSSKDNK